MDSVALYLLVVIVILAGAIYGLFIHPARRRRKLAEQPLSSQWQRWIAAAVPHYTRFSPELRLRLEQGLKVFMAEKRFYGCDGMELKDQHRVTIAAQACLLVINRTVDEFSAVQAILLYPSAFRVPAPSGSGPGSFGIGGEDIVSEHDSVHLGESWGEGRIILSWDDIEAEIAQRQAGQPVQSNVVLHEFAHQLDQAEGVSVAMSGGKNPSARVLARAYHELQQAAEQGAHTLLDPYGATDPAEFVAVATETFFEEPLALRDADPELYDVLMRLYRLDLAGLLEGKSDR